MSSAIESTGGENDTERKREEPMMEEDADADAEDTDDPLLELPSPVVQDGDHVILVFGDGRKVFCQCLNQWKGKTPPLKICKRSYPTANLIGLPYGTVLELSSGGGGLVPLPDGEGLLPQYPANIVEPSTTVQQPEEQKQQLETEEANASDTTFPPVEETATATAGSSVRDNRHLVDDNAAQSLGLEAVQKMRDAGTDGSVIVTKIIEHSSTFHNKTEFSKAKYVARKQMKYQPRCRLTRCTASTLCEAMFARDPKRLMNLREDTLAQILAYSNVGAGCQVLVLETVHGIVTGAIAERMGGYGRVLSVYSGQQPSYMEMIQRYNLSFGANYSIKWVHTGDVFGSDEEETTDTTTKDDCDQERVDRERLQWPCVLQDHTRQYLKTDLSAPKRRLEFLAKRSARFARKLTRHTDREACDWLTQRQSDALIIVSRYDPVVALKRMLPYLAPSCPFVVYSEFVEPLTECFRELQDGGLAINLRLSDTWAREYQVLPGRTHPNMNMSQSGGFLLTGVKLDPRTGRNEIDEALLKEIRAEIGGRRGKKTGSSYNDDTSKNNNNSSNSEKQSRKKKRPPSPSTSSPRPSKRQLESAAENGGG